MKRFEVVLLRVSRPNHIYARLNYSSVVDCITLFNLCRDQYDFVLVSKRFYKSFVDNDLLDNCFFPVVVSRFSNDPLTPVPCKYASSE